MSLCRFRSAGMMMLVFLYETARIWILPATNYPTSVPRNSVARFKWMLRSSIENSLSFWVSTSSSSAFSVNRMTFLSCANDNRMKTRICCGLNASAYVLGKIVKLRSTEFLGTNYLLNCTLQVMRPWNYLIIASCWLFVRVDAICKRVACIRFFWWFLNAWLILQTISSNPLVRRKFAHAGLKEKKCYAIRKKSLPITVKKALEMGSNNILTCWRSMRNGKLRKLIELGR